MANFDYQNPVLQTQEDAENVLAAMNTVVKEFSYVTVGDLKDLVGLPKTFEEDSYGWAILKEIKILVEVVKGKHVGFVLDLPAPGKIEANGT